MEGFGERLTIKLCSASILNNNHFIVLSKCEYFKHEVLV